MLSFDNLCWYGWISLFLALWLTTQAIGVTHVIANRQDSEGKINFFVPMLLVTATLYMMT
jgi:hypothetical protein